LEQDVALKKQLPFIHLAGVPLPVRGSGGGGGGGGGGGWFWSGNRLVESVLERLGLALLRVCFAVWVGLRQDRVRGVCWGFELCVSGRERREWRDGEMRDE